jgi:lysophospholipase L1-like esterase
MIIQAALGRVFNSALFISLALAFIFGQALFTTCANWQHPAITSSTPGASGQATRRSAGVFFEKLRAGKPVTIAYLGGPITAGAGASNVEKSSFRALVAEWFRQRYPKSEINELNAAINNQGTAGSSLYATLRARRDVIAFKPDLVFVEFAINDADEDELAVKKAIEGLLRQLLVVSQPPEVVMLYATNARRDVRSEWHDAIAAHYQVPSINFQNHIHDLIAAGKIKPADFWKEGANPSDAGHRIYADLIASFLSEQERLKPAPILRTLPPPLISDEMNYGEFKAFVEIRPDRWMEKRNARLSDTGWRIESNNDRTLPSLLLTSARTGAQIEYYFEGTVIGISYRTGPDCGIIECLIDGKPAPAPLARVDCYNNAPQLGARIIAGGLGPGEHKLSVRVLGEKNAKSSGNNVRLGYLLVGGTRPERL